ncbi:dipeptidase [Gorillibacterium massiliense]|uniref:dipeptidase n=1 Tax=Gorillibacterium massiliense TaxID=1280390 RepID=UPI0004B5E223|nr:dipeptidase [Gorillibacterium massiliense]
MHVIDTHCDILSRMLADPTISFAIESTGADVCLPRLRQGGLRLQFFALYLSERFADAGMGPILEMIDLYRERVLASGEVVPVRTVKEAEESWASGKIAGVLSLEGAEGLQGNLVNLRTLFQLGVRFLGLTWNHANWAADGVMEPRQGGFTVAGKRLIAECDRLGIILDVSHLSDNGFWQLAELSNRPFIASHSNSRSICNHPRNLTDEQIQMIVQRNGCISLTFVPWFIREKTPVITDILRHLDRFCALGAVDHIGFGSDFDGFDKKLPGLTNPSDYPAFGELLLKHFSEREVEGFFSRNWHSFLLNNLPVD